ncbi:MAG: hypothetical protein KGJ57_08495 [Sphingomonadales bacterium]|nr:hypothetical protein [Sphingomonadales bacterium]MDE2169450.1 hypothetical protein [Sphingomonadales bacterium]
MLALGATALALSLTTPAMAEGKADRAREAIAAAEAKIQAADTAGAGTLLVSEQAHAREELATAKEALASGHKDDAIADANHASMMAEANLGEAQRRKSAMNQARVAAAHAQVAAANQQAADAQQQAQDANARAAMAQNAAATSAADANAARQAAVAAQVAAATPPAQTETSVTTSTSGPATHHTAVRKRVVHTAMHKPATRVAETTTTVVKTRSN